MPHSSRLSAALLIASVVVACDPIAPADDDIPDPVERAAEREALTAFYINTDGDNWIDRAGWLVTADPCFWFGVTCSGGRGFSLIMESNNLIGSLPTELGSLTALKDIRLNSNSLTGPIPAELGDLTALTILNLLGNSLTGAVPEELGSLSALRILWLHENDLTGSVPATLGNLTALNDLRLFDNNLTGSIPAELGDLSALTTLLLDSNTLSGVVPLPVAVKGGELQQIDPSRCNLEPNPGLSIPDTQEYMDADLDGDGLICGIALSTASP